MLIGDTSIPEATRGVRKPTGVATLARRPSRPRILHPTRGTTAKLVLKRKEVADLFHKKRTWSVAPVASPEDLAEKLIEHTWTLCTGFERQGWLFLNDALSEDGAQEYGVIQRQTDKLIQVESVTFSWMTPDKALAFIRETLEGKLEVMYGEVKLKLETPETHGTCPLCA